jgi:hypothetical protein
MAILSGAEFRPLFKPIGGGYARLIVAAGVDRGEIIAGLSAAGYSKLPIQSWRT